MSHGSARIDSPDTIRNFRVQFVEFETSARNALMAVNASVRRVSEWLKGEQQLYWKKELRNRENAVNLAQSDYNRAKLTAAGKTSNAEVDAKKVLDKAKRRKDEAEGKLEATKRWAVRIGTEMEKLVGAVRSFEVLLDETSPRALSRLDIMVEKLEEYLRTGPQENG